MFELDILALNQEEAAVRLARIASSGRRQPAVVVTPNVDHLVRLEHASPEFKAMYASADAIFADGMPVVWASRLTSNVRLPGRVTGADLFVALSQHAAEAGLPVFVIGGLPGEESQIASSLAERFPGLKADVFSPSMQFEPLGAEGREALRRIEESRPAIVFVCLGMPKQERWAIAHRPTISASLVLCVGAAMEFALGQKHRAPQWMQRNGLEWFWRLVHEPRRLWRRYLVQSLGFLRLLRQERAAAAAAHRRTSHPK
ncbi:WecB/TagA/CpsF family glycosyltransferase [Xylophilus sp. GOD-11R]|uniref:WecB/TagA/CpsF family glycosyltransferase n=1 Tax=Xylophilus sp. GOD-11R TaxID=3089814 RepID=UPI00298CDFBD|nr:WecB/TagA/CpsF family glycosyltransferase [Xylophilus sp. GOD-11R]WPB56107.1 WecB/TagA/CpsF family glycosyltransferase [Xylophilus sp. GOD-11R]